MPLTYTENNRPLSIDLSSSTDIQLHTYIKNSSLLKTILQTHPQNFLQLIHKKNKFGNTPLHIAASYPEALAILLAEISKFFPEKISAILQIQNNDGDTVLHKAIKLEKSTWEPLLAALTPKQLFEISTLKNKQDETIIDLALSKQNNIDIIKKLLAHLPPENFLSLFTKVWPWIQVKKETRMSVLNVMIKNAPAAQVLDVVCGKTCFCDLETKVYIFNQMDFPTFPKIYPGLRIALWECNKAFKNQAHAIIASRLPALEKTKEIQTLLSMIKDFYDIVKESQFLLEHPQAITSKNLEKLNHKIQKQLATSVCFSLYQKNFIHGNAVGGAMVSAIIVIAASMILTQLLFGLSIALPVIPISILGAVMGYAIAKKLSTILMRESMPTPKKQAFNFFQNLNDVTALIIPPEQPYADDDKPSSL